MYLLKLLKISLSILNKYVRKSLLIDLNWYFLNVEFRRVRETM